MELEEMRRAARKNGQTLVTVRYEDWDNDGKPSSETSYVALSPDQTDEFRKTIRNKLNSFKAAAANAGA